MKKVNLAYAAIILAAMSLSSCSSGADEEEETSQSLTGYVNYVTDLATGETMAYSGVSYTINYNYSTMKSTLIVNQLKTNDGTSYPGLTFSNVAWTVDGSWKVISLSGVTPTATNFYLVPNFNSVKFELRDEVVGDDGYIPHTYISMKLGDQYQVYSLPKASVLTGTTTAVTPTSLISTLTTDESIYVAEIDPDTNTLDLTINNFQINDDSTILALAIKNIPFTIDKTDVSFAIDSAKTTIIGSVENADAYQWNVTNLSGSYTPKGFNLKYTINVDGTATNVTAVGTYK
jgi:hypothetical protein